MSNEILNALPEKRQRAFAQPFYTAARQGAKRPRDVVSAVLATAVEMVAAGDRDRGAEILRVIGSAPVEALDFGKYVLEHEALPAGQKTHERARQKGDYTKEGMVGPPTEKQLSYLRVLGYKGPAPTTKREASELIEELK